MSVRAAHVPDMERFTDRELEDLLSQVLALIHETDPDSPEIRLRAQEAVERRREGEGKGL